MRQTGIVKFFNAAKGYGFITPDGEAKDVFIHVTALERAGIRNVDQGTKLTFDLEDDRRGRGKQATNVELG
jgi:CspA family cold shock protein